MQAEEVRFVLGTPERFACGKQVGSYLEQVGRPKVIPENRAEAANQRSGAFLYVRAEKQGDNSSDDRPGRTMKRLKIRYVDHLLPLPEGLSPEVVQVYIGTSKNKVEMSILRNGFIVADPVMHTIESRIRQLDQATPRRGRSVAESVGLYPNVSPEWCKFFDDLLQRDESWAFLVPVIAANSLS